MISYYPQQEGQVLMVGLSSDVKPASAAGMCFIESDTGHIFYPDTGGTWAEATVVAAAAWGAISGTLADQADLKAALDLKQASSAISSAAFLASSFFAASSVISSAAFQASSVFALAGQGGADPWTYLKVSSQHYGTSNVAFSDLNGMRFTPGTNSTYEVEFHLMCRTSTAAVTPRIGVRWPTGTSSAGWINQGQTNSTQLFTWGNQLSTMQIPAAGLLATTTASWSVIGGATIQTFGATASSFAVQMATESTTVFVSTMIGSYLKYRTIP